MLAAASCGVGARHRPRRLLPPAQPGGPPAAGGAGRRGSPARAAGGGWKHPAYVHPEAACADVKGRALLSPFDSLIWFDATGPCGCGTSTTAIEIYVPAPKRLHGTTCCRSLLGDDLVARVDLKADRQRACSLLRASTSNRTPARRRRAGLAAELQLMAGWLGLGGVDVADRGDLAPPCAGR